MVKTKELTDFEGRKIIGNYKDGDTERAISKNTGNRKTNIHNIITKYRKTGVITVAPRSGPKKLTVRDKCHFKAIINKNRCEPEENLRKIFTASTGNDVSRSTMQRTLYSMGYNSCTVLRKSSIS